MPSTGLNHVILIGAVADEPRLSHTSKGTPRLWLRLHTVESYLDASGLERESQAWHTVVVYGKRAEALARFLRRGRRVAAEGRLEHYKTKTDPPQYRSEVVAKTLVLLDRDRDADDRRSAA